MTVGCVEDVCSQYTQRIGEVCSRSSVRCSSDRSSCFNPTPGAVEVELDHRCVAECDECHSASALVDLQVCDDVGEHVEDDVLIIVVVHIACLVDNKRNVHSLHTCTA
jgi:hypothetical protein